MQNTYVVHKSLIVVFKIIRLRNQGRDLLELLDRYMDLVEGSGLFVGDDTGRGKRYRGVSKNKSELSASSKYMCVCTKANANHSRWIPSIV